MRKLYKWVGAAIGVPFLLLAILFLLFYFPPFQNWAVRKTTAYASEKMGMHISVDHVRLSFPLDLAIKGVKLLQPNDSLPQVNDTVADIGKVIASVQLRPLLYQQVMVDQLDIKAMNVNTTHFIRNLRIKGKVGHLSLQAHGIDLKKTFVKVDNASLSDANLLVELSDTVPPDTTPSQNFWKVQLEQIQINNTHFALHLPGDTMSVKTKLGEASAHHAYLDLGEGNYKIQHLQLADSEIHYDRNYEPKVQGIDYNHLALSKLNLTANSFSYGKSQLGINVGAASFHEQSGLTVNHLQGAFAMDSLRLSLPSMALKTPSGTNLVLNYAMDLNAFDKKAPGTMSAKVRGQVSRLDLMTFIGTSLPLGLAHIWPSQPLVIVGAIGGNMQKARLKDVNIHIPTVAKLKADGFVENLTSPKQLKANLVVHGQTGNLDFIKSMVDRSVAQSFRIPRGIVLDTHVLVDRDNYTFNNLKVIQGGGSLRGHASVDLGKMSYQTHLFAHRLPLQNFIPHQGLHPFTGEIEARGSGTDIMSPSTQLQAKAHITSFRYGDYNLDGIDADAKIVNGHVLAKIDSRNPMFKGNLQVDALTRSKRLRATLSGDLTEVDLFGLHLSEQPLKVAVCAHVDVESDLKHYHMVQGVVSDIMVTSDHQQYRMEDVVMDVLTSRDTTHAIVNCGDFRLNMDGSGGYERLIKQGNRFVAELQSQMKNKYIDQVRLRERLPDAHIYLTSGKDNILCQILERYGFQLDNVFMNLTSSPITGLNGQLQIDSLVVDSFQVDTIRFKFASGQDNMTYWAQLRNGKHNPKYIFNALFDGAINEKGTYLRSRIYDWNDSLGIRLALQGSMEQNGVKLHLFGDKPILGYKEFTVNDSNYIFMGDDRRVSANMILKASDGMGVQIFTNDANDEALQDITVSLNKFNIGEALAMIPYTPNVKGIMNGDFHLIQTESELAVSSSVKVDDMVYEDSPMGDIGSEFTYMPKSDGSHYVDGILTHEGNEVGTLTGTYRSQGKGYLDATLGLDRLPVNLINGFIPDKLIGFKGYAEGDLTMQGSLTKPNVNGEVYLDSTYMFSEPYGVEMRFANDPVTITNSRLLFENFEMFAHNESPLNVKGYFDFSDLDRMNLNMRMRAENLLLVDSKETARSEAYGKAHVNFFGTMRGLLSNLQMRGRLDVLGTTDLNYNLKDSPLTTDNQLEGLVEFVDFKDTTKQVINRPPLTGFDMDLSINIDDGAHVDCYLNADHSNYIDIIGGGDMRLRYNIADNMRLTGRYTIGGGEMKYSLPIIPLKTFEIQDGSYIEFTGDPMNPRLNLRATENIKSTVNGDSGDGRSVEFVCGVVVTKTLNDMGLEFVIDAPEDMTISNQLQSMTKEGRGKVAVTMLTTGMYLADGNTSGFTMNSALSAFLNSQINQISGKALRSLDVSFGIDNSFSETGGLHTDYSFKFAKRFWNNRLRIVIGGKLSSGEDVTPQEETFFDNVTFEYRISPTSNKYLNLFYQRDSYDWLEGNVSKFGGGFLWKRKLASLKDLFKFTSDNDEIPALPADSARKEILTK